MAMSSSVLIPECNSDEKEKVPDPVKKPGMTLISYKALSKLLNSSEPISSWGKMWEE